MVTVTVSSKYQIVISAAIREKLNVHVGQKIQLIPYQNRIEIVPVQDIRETRGSIKGISTEVPRDGGSRMNLVDSSGWLEYLVDGNNADYFSPALLDT